MTSLGKYELHEQLGRGGFGTVYRAIDTTLDRVVALKILHPQLTTDPDFLERFRNEARLVASLRSPHIVTIHELGEVDGRVFIAMEYLAGGSLKQRLESGPIPYPETVEIMRQVCDGLSVAHAKGLVHRDIKPGNILLDEDGRAVIADFGLARAVQLSSTSTSSSTGGVGTPAYRAPELWRGKPPASPSTDIYSLGCVLSEMLTGKVLFDGSTPDEIITQHLVDGPQVPVSYPAGVPELMQAFIAQALNKDPQERFSSTSSYIHDLEKLKLVPAKHTEEIPESIPRITLLNTDKTQAEQSVFHPPSPAWQTIESPEKQTIKSLKPVMKILYMSLAGVAILALLIIAIINGVFNRETSATEVPTVSIATETQRPKPTGTMIPTKTSIPPTPTSTPGVGSTIQGADGMILVYVPAGTFTMGNTSEKAFIECQKFFTDCYQTWFEDEKPPHQVIMDGFWIDQTEVTNIMYAKCVQDNDCSVPSSSISATHDSYYSDPAYANYPVINVNWEQANDYCTWANRQLPTEAQWEYAAKGPIGSSYPWGNDKPSCELANYRGCDRDTQMVGKLTSGKSWVGAYDLAGNVWEWVADWYDEGFYSISNNLMNPTGPSQTNVKVLRGGSWINYEFNIRSAQRARKNPADFDNLSGFRCLLPYQ